MQWICLAHFYVQIDDNEDDILCFAYVNLFIQLYRLYLSYEQINCGFT